MQVFVKKYEWTERDPFKESDRVPGGYDAGKGDCPRNVSQQFKQNYDLIRWEREPLKPGQFRKYRKVYR